MPSDIPSSFPLKINVPQRGSIEVKSAVYPGAGGADVVKIYGDQTIAGNKTFTGITSGITKSMVGLSSVDNTRDVDKPISSATQLALDLKADKVLGKQLSDENYTLVEKIKLSGIANGAEVNVNADWNSLTGDSFILNKPILGSASSSSISDFATAAQGALADSSLQPRSVDYRGEYNNGDGTYSIGSVVRWNSSLYQKISNPGNPGYPPSGSDWQLFEAQVGSPAYDLFITSQLNTKVDKVDGQGLSDENYTLTEKDKLDAIVPSKLINGLNEVELRANANLHLAQGGGIVFDRNNTSINVGMGFHIRSGEGVAIEPVDQYDSENLITRGWYFSTDGSLVAPNNDYYYARSYIILNNFPAQDSGFGLTTPDGATHDFYYDYDGVVGPGTPILVNPSTDSVSDVATKTMDVLNASALFGYIHWDSTLNYIWIYQNVAGETGNQTNNNYGYADGVSAFTGGESSRIVFGDGTVQSTAPTADAYLLDRTHHTGSQSYTTITGLGSLATQDGTFSNVVNKNETQIITAVKEFTASPIVPRPTSSGHAVNKAYADDISAGLHVHEQVHVILTVSLESATGGTVDYTNGTDGVGAKLTVTGGSTVIAALNTACGFDEDLIAGANGSRVIINGEAANKNWNGIYNITADRELTRAVDFDSSVEMAGGDFVFVTHGTTHADTGWVSSEAVITVGTSPVEFVQFSGQGAYDAGDGLRRDGTVFTVVGSTGRIVVGPSVDLDTHGTPGTYHSVTTDEYGRVTSGSKPTTLEGYGITDAAALSGATFTGPVKATSFATSTGTSSQFLKADGSLDTTTYVNYDSDSSTATISPRGIIKGSSYGCNQLDVTSYTMGIRGLLYGINVQTSTDRGDTNLHNWYFNSNGTFTFPDNTVQATAFTGLQTITLTGDVTGSGTGNFSTTLKNTGTAGTYNNSATSVTPFTTDSAGRINSTGAAIPITPAWSSITSTPTTLGGYGIGDAVSLAGSQTISGEKTFGLSPHVPLTPTINTQAASKGYVDTAVSAKIGSDTTGLTGATALTNIVQITQAGYNAITTPLTNTLYIIA